MVRGPSEARATVGLLVHGPARITTQMEPIGLVGYGAIAQAVVAKLREEVDGEPNIVGVLILEGEAHEAPLPFVTELDEVLSRRPRVIAECASHEAVHLHGERILRSGVDLIVISIGALADSALFDRLRSAARESGSRLILPSGAIGAVDALSAARLAGLERVCYRSRKPPRAWKGTPAEDAADLDRLTSPRVVYRGSAREAAVLFPKNTNAVAAVALAGLGFEKTEVELVADPTVSANIHEIDVSAETGDFSITLSGKPSVNPQTSMLTAYSVARALLAYTNPVLI